MESKYIKEIILVLYIPKAFKIRMPALKDWMQVLIQSAMVGKTDQGMLACLTDGVNKNDKY